MSVRVVGDEIQEPIWSLTRITDALAAVDEQMLLTPHAVAVDDDDALALAGAGT